MRRFAVRGGIVRLLGCLCVGVMLADGLMPLVWGLLSSLSGGLSGGFSSGVSGGLLGGVSGGLSANALWGVRTAFAASAKKTAAPTVAPVLGAPLAPDDAPAFDAEFVLTIGGDCVLGSRDVWKPSDLTFDTKVAKEGSAWPFSGIAALFAEDDATLVNLECVLQDSKKGFDRKKLFCFRGPAENARMLTLGNIEQVNLANNHFIDYTASGRKSTVAALEAAGVSYSGYGYTAVAEKNGIRVGFAGVRETTYFQKRALMKQDIDALKKLKCDVIVYSCHFGKEYAPTRNRKQETMAQEAVRLGADVVVGTHPHCVQGMEALDGAVVFYSLGNLVFGGTIDMTTFDGMVARLSLRFAQGTYLGAMVTLMPVLTSGSAPVNDFRPQLAQGADAERILALAQADTVFPIAREMWFPSNEPVPVSFLVE